MDRRPAEILRLVGDGATGRDAAAKLGINRRTVIRWREQIAGFGEAYDRAAKLSREETAEAREELDQLVAAWTPGAAAKPDPEHEPDPETLKARLEREPEWVRERLRPLLKSDGPAEPTSVAAPSAVVPDVLDSSGAEITVHGSRPPAKPASPYTTARPPTRDEWLAEMAAMAKDPKQPERVRVTAIAAVSTGLFGGPGGRSTRPADLDDVAMAAAAQGQARGRDPGVPASVWQEARRNFLGPAPAPADDSKGADVVELEQATPS